MYVSGWKSYSICLIAALGLAGCSSSESGTTGGGSTTTSIDNISGKVSSTSSTSSIGGFQSKVSKKSDITTFEAGCTVEARDMKTNTLVASATSDAEGDYTLKGVTAGQTYRVTATCGTNKYSAVATAVKKDPTTITDAEKVATNPRSTIIAAYIVKAVIEAVTEATASLPASAQAAVTDAIMSALDSVIQTITATIEEAIDSGAMEEPDVTQASAVAENLKEATSTTDVGTALTSAPTAPVAVDQAVTGAKNSSVALQACDSALQGTEATCIQAIAKLMYNVLGFPVGIVMSDGAFGAVSSCATAGTVGGGSTTLGDLFPNAEFFDHAADSEVPAGMCAIVPKVATTNRNRGYENGGKDDGPIFTESADLDGDTTVDTGLITELGKHLFAKSAYNLASIDKFIFGSTSGAGMNARLINKRFTSGAGQGTRSFYYLDASGSWTNNLWPNDCNSMIGPCDFWNLDIAYTNGTWTGGTHSALAEAIGGGDNTGLKVFFRNFGGTIPTQAELDAHIDSGRTHSNHNITGEKEFRVVTTKPPGWSNDGSNACWDNNPATACLDQDGAAIVPYRVDLTFGTADATTKVKPITVIAPNAASGAYYMRPYFGPNGFSGVVGFVKASDGRILRDELMRDRAVKIVFSNAENGTPGSSVKNQIYNVELDWSSCNSQGTCPGFTVIGTDPITTTDLTLPVQTDYRANFENYCDENGCKGHQLVGSGDWSNMTPYKFSVATGANADVFSLTGVGKAANAGEYNIAVWNNCDVDGCTFLGFYFVDSAGAPHVDADAGGTASQGVANIYGTADVGLYTPAFVSTDNDFDDVAANTQTIDDTNLNHWVFEGPVRNPNFSCEAEPFFVDGNANGVLDCEVTAEGYSQASAASGDISFSGDWEYSWYTSDPSLSGAERTTRQGQALLPRDNAYLFGDPVGTKKLMATAFNGWFDGQHTLAEDTSLDALKVFALIYLFFEEGSDGSKHIEGLVNGQSEFMVESPIFSQAGTIKSMNESLGKGFLQFKTN